MKELINSPLVHVCLTLIVFILSKKLQKRYKSPLLNPILITVSVVILFLLFTDTSYADYERNTQVISFWLAPSVVALGYALYSFLEEIKADFRKIVLSMLAGSLTGIISVFMTAYLFGASKVTMISLAPKSVTMPIAIEVSKEMGGIPSLTVAFVIIVGVLGAIFGQTYLSLIGVNDPKSVGLSLGATSHALGAASISERGPDFSAFGGLGMALNGVVTAIFAPWVIKFLLLLLY
ncbi:LrgB family protein [Ancylomarina sp. 16SWW S1-10-2]|uniref:LrgB family protein n=1 Tax=Ancylomarina sp. 16SWW S1-10-2 TaxID=2499681 RepID=UPI00189F69DA|nr:LrgB family protein [Ancylomarina sp. 16SWW S1-10-2]